jgi:hypothetical protein
MQYINKIVYQFTITFELSTNIINCSKESMTYKSLLLIKALRVACLFFVLPFVNLDRSCDPTVLRPSPHTLPRPSRPCLWQPPHPHPSPCRHHPAHPSAAAPTRPIHLATRPSPSPRHGTRSGLIRRTVDPNRTPRHGFEADAEATVGSCQRSTTMGGTQRPPTGDDAPP